jgi:FkbM family methyltransferase
MPSAKSMLKGLLHRVFPREGAYNIVRILAGPARGVRMKLDIREGGSYLTGQYDRWIFDRVRLDRLVRPGMVAWDCGAFYGYYASAFRKLVGAGGRVEVFEASRTNHAVVATLPGLNGWRNVHVHKLAIGPDHSVIRFTTNLGGSSGPYGLDKDYGVADATLELEDVTCCGVDELIGERGVAVPDIIKFDLETAEIHALHNGPGLFTGRRPLMLLELHGEESMRAAGDFLQTYRYRAYSVWQLHMPGRSVFTDRASLEAFGSVPHMLLCHPAEDAARIDAIYPV